MNLLEKLSHIARESRAEYEKRRKGDFVVAEVFGKGKNILAMGDNLSFMSYLMEKKGLAGKIQMIYSDPPFFSRSKYTATVPVFSGEGGKTSLVKIPAYDDIWLHDMGEYLAMLTLRLRYMKDLLADEGLLWLHLDWHAVHYVKVMLDEIFGEDRLVNEIIWHYKSGGSSKRHFARKHDTILLYSKTDDYKLKPGKEKSYNREGKPYRFKGVEEFFDEGGWYTVVNQKDVWQMDMVGRTAKERTGYGTQKPMNLLRRIVESSTEPGDLCADFFCGSGTLAVAAEELNRKWICCDREKLAIAMSEKRILGGDYSFLVEAGIIGTLDTEEFNEASTFYRTEKRIVDTLGNMVYSKRD